MSIQAVGPHVTVPIIPNGLRTPWHTSAALTTVSSTIC